MLAEMSIVFGVLAAILDVSFMYCLYQLAIHIPKPNQDYLGHKTRIRFTSPNKSCLDKYNIIKLWYPDYFYNEKACDNAEYIHCGPVQKDYYHVSPPKSCSCSMHCEPLEFASFFIRFWNVVCAILFIVLLIVLMFIIIFEYLVVCYFDSTKSFIFPLIGVFISLLTGYVFLLFLNKAFNATLLLWWNISNEFNTNIQWIWGVSHFIIWFLYTFINIINEDANFDRGFWPTMLFFMIIRGMIWVTLFILVTIISNMYIVYFFCVNVSNHNIRPDNLNQPLITPKPKVDLQNVELIVGSLDTDLDPDLEPDLEPKEEEKDDNQSGHISNNNNTPTISLFEHQKHNLAYLTKSYFIFGAIADDREEYIWKCKVIWIKYGMVGVFATVVLLFFILSTYSNSLNFAAVMLLVFYTKCTILDKVDFDGVYCIWNGKYHQKFWKTFTNYWNDSGINQFPSDILCLHYFDFWCQLARHKHDYWWGYRTHKEDKDQINNNDDMGSTLGIRCKKRHRHCLHVIFNILFILIIAIAPFIFYTLGISDTFSSENNKSESTTINWMNIANESEPYPMCQTLDINDLDVIDLVFLTSAAYYVNNLHVGLHSWFGNTTEWNIDYVHNGSSTAYNSIWAHISKNDTEVILVRGTEVANDVIQDLSLWSEIGFIQAASFLIPITSMTSTDFLRSYVNFASDFEGIIDKRRSYYDSIYNYVRTNLSNAVRDEEKTIIILGHSLGGGIAQIVAAKLLDHDNGNNILSFGLASPGTLYSSQKFNFSVNSLHETSISVLPERDVVSQVDVHGGAIQNIKCGAEHSVGCHMVTTHFCSLVQNCGKLDLMTQSNKKHFIECVCNVKTDWPDCY